MIGYHLCLCDVAGEYRADRATISAARHADLLVALASPGVDREDAGRIGRLFVAGDVADDRVEFTRKGELVGRSVYSPG